VARGPDHGNETDFNTSQDGNHAFTNCWFAKWLDNEKIYNLGCMMQIKYMWIFYSLHSPPETKQRTSKSPTREYLMEKMCINA
jgi:hypothetical protein